MSHSNLNSACPKLHSFIFFPVTVSPSISDLVELQISSVSRAKNLRVIVFYFLSSKIQSPNLLCHSSHSCSHSFPDPLLLPDLNYQGSLWLPSTRTSSWTWVEGQCRAQGLFLEWPQAWSVLLCSCHLKTLNDSSLDLCSVSEVQWDSGGTWSQGMVPPPTASRDGFPTALFLTLRHANQPPRLCLTQPRLSLSEWQSRGQTQALER